MRVANAIEYHTEDRGDSYLDAEMVSIYQFSEKRFVAWMDMEYTWASARSVCRRLTQHWHKKYVATYFILVCPLNENKFDESSTIPEMTNINY